MPQLETATYLTQYRWTLIALFLLFSFMVVSILPTIKTNFLIRKLFLGGLAKAPKMSDLSQKLAWLWSKALIHYENKQAETPKVLNNIQETDPTKTQKGSKKNQKKKKQTKTQKDINNSQEK